MLEFYFYYQLARQPLQAVARRLVCHGLVIATNGRHQCPEQAALKSAED
jgi:hypothetical protein